MAQEFHISVTPLGDDQYLVRIERVAPGVPLAEEQVRWPVDDWLTQARQLMNDPLLGLFQGSAGGVEDFFFLSESNQRVSQSCSNLIALGQELYNALFQGSLRDSWMMAQAIAQNQRQVLRLRLGLKGNRLPRLPWEVLHAGDRPLATGTDVAFSRYELSTGLRRPLHHLPGPLNQPLKILMVIAGPSDQESLELAQEAAHLQAELRNRARNEPPAIQLTILEQPGREQLTQALEQGQYQVFHYAGHSSLGDSGGDVYLVSNKTGLTETLNGDDLAGLLANNGVQLAVFNSCRGAYTAASDPVDIGKDRNLAEALVKRGIPGVLAMAERIPDEVALTLTRLLYRNINQGYPIDLSLSRARQGLISAYGSNQLYWALPVLYLHPEFDGFLANSDNDTHNREERLQLPELPESTLASQMEAELFSPSPRLNANSFPEDEFVDDSMVEFGAYEDEEFAGWMDNSGSESLESDDPSSFIQNLLQQLNTESTQGGSAAPVFDASNSPNVLSEGNSLVVNLPNDPPQDSVTPLSPVLTPPSENPTTSPKAPNPSQIKASRHWWQTWRSLPRLGMVFGVTSGVVLALLGVWFFQNRGLQPIQLWSKSSPSIPAIPQNSGSGNVDLQKADTPTVTGIAIEQFSRGNIAAGQTAVEKLLNDGALPQAKAALEAIPQNKLDDPAVSFLRGRLAWQSIQKGSADYNLDDVRRYWETAVKAKPDSATYHNALGFAYYAEGDFDRANNAWLDALTLIEQTQIEVDVTGGGAKREAMNAYAGLALGFWKSAQQQPANKRANLLNESLKLRQKVLRDDPVNFQPDALSKSQNWLWTEQAIQDWRSLLALNS
ncbi:MAG TPA: CHAT domain-containing protein [Cyanobacteria bacterium UBA8803]|nr:CHAT domain-containing protein [Cyanobacteria bacterium UBA9273]HBL58379.1 CHAT domain-containing protein [Cyanobacteria bacterium UBA8803]